MVIVFILFFIVMTTGRNKRIITYIIKLGREKAIVNINKEFFTFIWKREQRFITGNKPLEGWSDPERGRSEEDEQSISGMVFAN